MKPYTCAHCQGQIVIGENIINVGYSKYVRHVHYRCFTRFAAR